MKNVAKKTASIKKLLFNSGWSMRAVNLITLYRIIAFPLLIYLLLKGQLSIFKWLLAVSFFTDAIDGFLARKYNVTSALGAKLDSIGDDLTVLAAIVGLFLTRIEFIKEHVILLSFVTGLYLIQLTLSLIRYKQISSFHTYLAKLAAVIAAAFLLSTFFLEEISYPLFYLAVVVTAIELIEEIILVFIVAQWKTNVKGLYWVLMKKNSISPGNKC